MAGAGAAVDTGVTIGLLGPLEVRRHGVVVELPRGRSRTLLALLALAAGRIVATERLIDELWGTSPPATVMTALHGLVSGLRKRLEPDRVEGDAPQLLVTRASGYLLDLPPEQVDVHRFRALVEQAATAAPDARIVLLRDALALWRGPALSDVVFAGAAGGEVTALDVQRRAAHERRIDADLELGRHRGLLGELEALVAEQPFNERLYARLMVAYYRSGRQTDALELWRSARATLVDQIGVEPGPGLRRVHQAILEQDPALDLEESEPTGNEPDDATRDLAVRAAELLATAGARVYDRHHDAVIAEELFSHAEILLPVDHPLREPTHDRISESYLMFGRHGDADARSSQALATARRRGDQRRERRLILERTRIHLITGPDPTPMVDLEAIGATALQEAEEAGDDELISQACYVLGLVALRRGRIRRMEELARHGLTSAERSGSSRERLAARWWVALALVEGTTSPGAAIAECEELADLGTDHHPGVLAEMARLHARQGEHDLARKDILRATGFLEARPGLRRPAMFVAQRAAEVELTAGDLDHAEPYLRRARTIADELHEQDQRAQLAARLARLLAERGNMEQARDLGRSSRHVAPRESVTAQALWRAAQAAILTASGDRSAAQDLLEEALALVPDELELLRAELRAQRGTTDRETAGRLRCR
jgi:DNA-binding SARP family transcriptional activator